MYSLLSHNTFGIDAACRDFKEYDTLEQLHRLLPSLRDTNWLHIGGGSNLLFTKDYEGTILHSLIRGVETVRENDDEVWIKVGAGVIWDDLVALSTEQGWHGLENLSYIPGEVGASAIQNIGAYGVEVGSHIDHVMTLEVATGREVTFTAAECRYAYRSSIFKHELKGKYIVTHVCYRLSRRFAPDLDYGAIRREAEHRGMTPESLTPIQLRQLIIEIRKAKLPEPHEIGSAGSFFMNPIVSQEKFEALSHDHPDMPHYLMPDGVKIPAGWMIEQCGWKGKRLGPAGVYPKQALVLVNLGGATGADIVRLSDAIRHDVAQRFGIDIHPEVNFI